MEREELPLKSSGRMVCNLASRNKSALTDLA